jgi:hypothetical protein
MKALKITLIVIGVIILLNVAVTGINIMQNGGKYDGRSIEKILGIPADKATLKDIQKLSKAEVFQLFYASPAPSLSDLKGEYKAFTLPLGILATPTDFYTHHFFGPGRWEGKAFATLEKDKAWGYNIFAAKDKDGKTVLARTRKMNTYIGTSTIDDKPSYHLDYSPYNSGTVHSMHDELRRINDNLYIGMGHMALGGGAINPAPFVVIGPPEKWVGADKE